MTLSTEPSAKSDAALEARRLALIRFEHAAGAAFGCDEAASAVPPTRFLAATIALAVLAAALAAAITCLA